MPKTFHEPTHRNAIIRNATRSGLLLDRTLSELGLFGVKWNELKAGIRNEAQAFIEQKHKNLGPFLYGLHDGNKKIGTGADIVARNNDLVRKRADLKTALIKNIGDASQAETIISKCEGIFDGIVDKILKQSRQAYRPGLS